MSTLLAALRAPVYHAYAPELVDALVEHLLRNEVEAMLCEFAEELSACGEGTFVRGRHGVPCTGEHRVAAYRTQGRCWVIEGVRAACACRSATRASDTIILPTQWSRIGVHLRPTVSAYIERFLLQRTILRVTE